MSNMTEKQSIYQASKVHMSDIKYKLKHMVRKRSRLKRESKPTLLNQVPVCPVRAGVELDARYQDVAFEDRFNDVIYPNVEISFTFNSIFQLLFLLFEPTRIISFLPALISFACGQLMYRALYSINPTSGTGMVTGSITIFTAVVIITLMVPFSAVIESIRMKYRPFTSTDEKETNDVPLLTMEEMMELKSSLPWYLTQPDVQQVGFIDQLLQKLWPRIEYFIREKLDEKVLKNQELVGRVYDATKGFVTLRVTSASIGNHVPKITGIRVLKDGVPRDVVVIDAELTFKSDLDFSVEGTLNLGNIFQRYEIEIPLNAGLKSVHLRVRSRIIFSPIFSSPPIIGSVNLSLIEPPWIDWHFVGLLRVFNINVLKRFPIKLISSLMADPHSVTINLAEFVPSQEMIQGVPSQLIQVDVISCANLPRNQDKHSLFNLTFFKPDSFVVVEVDGERRWTHIDPNNCDPRFNRSFSFMSSNPSRSYIKVFVYDDDMDQDVLLGQVSIPAKFWSENGTKYNRTAFTCNLFHPIGLKQLVNERKEKSTITFRVSTYKLSKDKSLMNGVEKREEEEVTANRVQKREEEGAISAVISVFVDSATNLNQVPLSLIRSPELRCLVRVEAGNRVEVTSMRERRGDPIFKQLVRLAVINPKLENVTVSVVDMYWVMERRSYRLVGSKRKSRFTDWAMASREGSVVGSVEINTLDVLNSPGMKIDGIYELTGFVENGSIKISIEVHLVKSTGYLILNRNLDPVQFPDPNIFLENKFHATVEGDGVTVDGDGVTVEEDGVTVEEDSTTIEDGVTIDTRDTSSTMTTTISGKEVPKKKPFVNISNLDTTINLPL